MNLYEARWWKRDGSAKVICELCPHGCRLAEGQTGFCGVRQVEGGALKTSVFGGTRGLCVDPIEKKPLYHFLPGSRVLSFGMRGCTLACDFCQNASLSQDFRDLELTTTRPEDLVRLAQAQGCASVAFTYNEPIVSAEWCLEVAAACQEAGLLTVAVTSGYIEGAARTDFFETMDAANVDLKSFSEAFYRKRCRGRLQPVLETLEYLAKDTRTWLEITTLLIPGENDDEREIAALLDWIGHHLGPEIPLHFTAFHPAHHLRDRPRTPTATLQRARSLALERGLAFVYTGNIQDEEGGITVCPRCGEKLIKREYFQVLRNRIRKGYCPDCGDRIAGRFD